MAAFRVASALIAAAAFAGCAGPSASSAKSAGAVEARANSLRQLARDMPAAQVRDLLGAPEFVKPLSTGGASGQIWSYSLKTDSEARAVAVATEERPAVNPLTGRDIKVLEPIYQIETTTNSDTLYLLMVDDRLVEWRIVRKSDRSFN